MSIKAEGQEAVSRIVEIRSYFPKAGSLKAKEDYIADFKAAVLKLVAYLKTENNPAIVAELKPKLPALE